MISLFAERGFAAPVAGLGLAAQVHHHFEQVDAVVQPLERVNDVGRQSGQQGVQVVGDNVLAPIAYYFVWIFGCTTLRCYSPGWGLGGRSVVVWQAHKRAFKI